MIFQIIHVRGATENNMNYEIALKLKEAGYPQGGGDWQTDTWLGPRGDVYFRKKNNGDIPNFPEDAVFIPSLSQLIEACGENFTRLTYDRVSKSFSAYQDLPKLYTFTYGSTPEEAVGKLWLELNRK